MRKFQHLVVVAGIAVAASAFGEERVTRTEKTVTRSENANGTTQVTRTVTTTVTTYVDQLRTVYQSVGLPEPIIVRLVELDRQIYQAYVAGNWTQVRQLRIEQRRLLNDDQVVKIYNHFESNPLPADIAPIATYTYIPQQQFRTYVVENQTGRIDPGTLSVPGVRATATFQTGENGTNVIRDGGETRATIRTGETENATELPGQIKTDTDTDVNRATIGTESDTDTPKVGTTEMRSGTDNRTGDVQKTGTSGADVKTNTTPQSTTIKTNGTEAGSQSQQPAATRGYESSNAPHPAGTNPAGQSHAAPTSESTGAGQSQSQPSSGSPGQSQSSSDKSDKQ